MNSHDIFLKRMLMRKKRQRQNEDSSSDVNTLNGHSGVCVFIGAKGFVELSMGSHVGVP